VSIARLAASFVLSALAGCGGGDDLSTTRAAIAHGELDEHRGVVAVLTTSTGTICSGVVVAPRVVLTARHCVAPVENGPNVACARTRFGATVDPDSVAVATTTEGATPDRRHGVVRVLVPENKAFCGYDIAALILARPLEAALVVPLRDEPAKSGETFTALGFGRDGEQKSGTRRRREGLHVSCVGDACANRQLASAEWWGEGAVCDGDSGGPALDEGGRVLGIASRKREGCAATVYLDVAASAQFVQASLEEAERTPEGAEGKGACSIGRGSSGAAPVVLLMTLAAARSRRSPRRRRDCARMPARTVPPRSV
jgi:hypothetical protein